MLRATICQAWWWMRDGRWYSFGLNRTTSAEAIPLNSFAGDYSVMRLYVRQIAWSGMTGPQSKRDEPAFSLKACLA